MGGPRRRGCWPPGETGHAAVAPHRPRPAGCGRQGAQGGKRWVALAGSAGRHAVGCNGGMNRSIKSPAQQRWLPGAVSHVAWFWVQRLRARSCQPRRAAPGHHFLQLSDVLIPAAAPLRLFRLVDGSEAEVQLLKLGLHSKAKKVAHWLVGGGWAAAGTGGRRHGRGEQRVARWAAHSSGAALAVSPG